MVPMDHGATLGPIEGIQDYLKAIYQVNAGGADVLVLHKGLLREVTRHPELARGRYLLHLSVSTQLGPVPHSKVLVSSVEEGIRLGADGISIHTNLGAENEAEMIKDFGKVVSDCQQWGMPLLSMIYSVKEPKQSSDLSHAARLAEELGADIVKVAYPGSIEEMEKIIRSVRIPVIISGGSKMDKPENLLLMVNDALLAGASGVSIGRNVFQSENPRLITGLISKLVHGELRYREMLG